MARLATRLPLATSRREFHMNNDQITAWKDPTFRASLDAGLVAFVAHPSGPTWSSLGEAEVRQAIGATPGNDAGEQAESGGYICTYTTETCWCC
jgi:mersacidin/lichenicidin family type 2 lantibiotic